MIHYALSEVTASGGPPDLLLIDELNRHTEGRKILGLSSLAIVGNNIDE